MEPTPLGKGPQRKPDPIPLSPINEVFRVRIIGECEGQLTVNTFAYREFKTLAGNGSRAIMDALHIELVAANGFLDKYLACLSVDWVGTSIYIDVPTKTDIAPVAYGMVNKVGAGPVGHCPTTVSGVVHKLSTWKGRHGRGRVGLPAVPLAWVLGSKFDPLPVPAYQAFSDAIATALVDGTYDWRPGILGLDKRTFPADPAKWAYTWVDIGEGTYNPILGNVRRRRPGRGK